VAEAVEKAANNGHDGSCGHRLFMDFSEEIELRECNFAFLVVELMCAFQISEFIFWKNSFIFA